MNAELEVSPPLEEEGAELGPDGTLPAGPEVGGLPVGEVDGAGAGPFPGNGALLPPPPGTGAEGGILEGMEGAV